MPQTRPLIDWLSCLMKETDLKYLVIGNKIIEHFSSFDIVFITKTRMIFKWLILNRSHNQGTADRTMPVADGDEKSRTDEKFQSRTGKLLQISRHFWEMRNLEPSRNISRPCSPWPAKIRLSDWTGPGSRKSSTNSDRLFQWCLVATRAYNQNHSWIETNITSIGTFQIIYGSWIGTVCSR